ncbi:MAG: hypothetical protein ACI841_000048 [Planctomycetota bacterium]|jgi:hypothetical protein
MKAFTHSETLALILPLLVASTACSSEEAAASEPTSGPEAGGSDRQRDERIESRPQDSTDDAASLRSLGYVDVVEDEDELDEGLGPVSIYESEAVQDGLTYFTNVKTCSSHLIDIHGTVLRSWHLEGEVWGNSILLPNGDVLAVHRDLRDEESVDNMAASRRLLRFNWDGDVIWEHRLPVHHDVDLLPDGRFACLTYEHRIIPAIHESIPVKDHDLQLFDSEGVPGESYSLTQLLLESSETVTIQSVEPETKDGAQEVDLLHTNALEFMERPELAAQNELYAPSNVMLCLRHQDLILIVDWTSKEILWSWGQGEISGPHDATLLANGNVLLFDNGLNRKWSRIVEVDPRTDKIVWEYAADVREDFFTVTRGAAERLPNGNTLVTYSRTGTLFEVSPTGDLLWEYRNPREADGKPRSRIVRARRVQRVKGEAGVRFLTSD